MSGLQTHILGIVRIQPELVKIRRGSWWRWQCPRPSRYKLNADGSSQNGVSMGGGVLRDDMGRVLAIFSHFYGIGTNMMAEFLALRDGLELCKSLGIMQLDVESDSAIVVQTITRKYTNGWNIIYVRRQCLALWQETFTIRHTYRQSNGVADRCADWATFTKPDVSAMQLRSVLLRFGTPSRLISWGCGHIEND